MSADTPLKIGIVCYPSPGGSGIVATELACELARRGHDVHIFSHDVPFRLDPCRGRLTYHPVTAPEHPVLVAAPYEAALAGTIVNIVRRVRLDVLHVHYAVPHVSAAWLAASVLGDRAPAIVATLHGSDVTMLGRDPALRPVLAHTLERAHAVTTVSAYMAEKAREQFGLGRPIDVIPNFVDPAVYGGPPDRSLRAQYAGPDEAVVLHASNFRPVKKVEDVVRIFARIARRRPARLLLVGEGPDSPAAYRQAVVEDVEDRVVFMGTHPNVAPIFRIADLFLLPSADEGFGLSALEAMAAGVPVVASAVGGLPEVIEHGVSGLLYPPEDVEAMAEGGLRLLTDAAFRETIVANARRRVMERFTAERVIPMYVEVYRRAVARATRPAAGATSRFEA
ncbi:MAG: N-acetyl-alpha-D-glucosaminyl L-malate synthase BshA [Clostridia bacterium]|nr:N-acetyl-alpha-D-glucosaminyl L-malate synthase BshA [Clostridia bacterium]